MLCSFLKDLAHNELVCLSQFSSSAHDAAASWSPSFPSYIQEPLTRSDEAEHVTTDSQELLGTLGKNLCNQMLKVRRDLLN